MKQIKVKLYYYHVISVLVDGRKVAALHWTLWRWSVIGNDAVKWENPTELIGMFRYGKLYLFVYLCVTYLCKQHMIWLHGYPEKMRSLSAVRFTVYKACNVFTLHLDPPPLNIPFPVHVTSRHWQPRWRHTGPLSRECEITGKESIHLRSLARLVCPHKASWIGGSVELRMARRLQG